jgi:hypothetical protein
MPLKAPKIQQVIEGKADTKNRHAGSVAKTSNMAKFK